MKHLVLAIIVFFSICAKAQITDSTHNYFSLPPDSINKALDKFFVTLAKSNTTLIRVAHFGASESEGDRTTNELRKLFQQRFGGSGLGFIPLADYPTNMSLTRTMSANWKRYDVFGSRNSKVMYGFSGTVCRFLPYSSVRNDSLARIGSKDSVTYTYHDKAVLEINMNKGYEQLRLMYGKVTDDCKLTITNKKDNTILYDETLSKTDQLTFLTLPFKTNATNLHFEFRATNSPEWYGLFADSRTGVQVDNYAIRGHSGDGLMLLDNAFTLKQINLLNTKLIIFQYGINAVPWLKDKAGCDWTADIYYRLFRKFRQLAPDVSIVVIGVADLVRKENGVYSSYPIIPTFRDSMKSAALRAGCAYWDLYEAMGGQNSLLTWAKNGWAGYDGHYTQKGEAKIAQLFFDDMMKLYQKNMAKN